MFYFIYDILLFLVMMIYLPLYALRGKLHPEILTRIGFFKKGYFDAIKGKDVVWIHAVSVGEARSADALLKLIRQRWTEKGIVVSCVTAAGNAIIRKALKEGEVAFYAPIDISFIVKKILSYIKPSLLIIMETEIWPNLIRLAKKQGAPVVFVNGRISDKSYKKYTRFKYLLKNVFRDVDLFCMQNDEARNRIIALGAPVSKVVMSGNIKFDISSDLKESPVMRKLKNCLAGCLFLIAGSTHEGEEEIITGIYKSLRKDFPTLRLLIASRHLDRNDKIARMIKLNGLEAVPVSRLTQISSAQIAVLDTVGDLSNLYQLCDIAFIGRSLVEGGGHNPIEPALFGKPIIFGRYMENFREIRDIFIKEKAAIEVKDAQALEYELRRLLGNSGERRALGERAKGLLDKNRGAVLRAFSEIEKIV